MAEPDPLEDPARCRCEGTGWVQVQPAYADAHLPDLDLFMAEHQVDEQTAQLAQAQLERQRAALADSVYPCRVHNARLFFRWAGGHLAKDHDRKECADCTAETPRRQRRRWQPAANTEPEPQRERYP